MATKPNSSQIKKAYFLLCPWTSVQEKLAMVQPEKTKKGDGDGLLQSLSSQTISAQVKCDVMQKAVETCPKFNMVSSS